MTANRDARGIHRAVLALAVTAALLAGCSSSNKDATSTTTSTAATPTTATGATTTTAATTSTAASSTTSAATSSSSTAAASGDSVTDSVPSGTVYVYFKGSKPGTIEGQPVTLVTFDEVQFLTGPAALAAAKAHHAVDQDATSLDNDYFIVNDNTKLRTLAVVPDAEVSKLGCDGGCSTQVPAGADEVAATKTLYKILVQNVRGISTITSIEGVFVP